MTVSELIYGGWLNTPLPLEYHTATAKGEPVTKEVNFLDPHTFPAYDTEYSGRCNLCGAEVRGGVPLKKLLGSSYMDWAVHKCSEATHICTACAFCLSINAKEGRAAVLRYPLTANRQGLRLLNRSEMRDALVSPPSPPFVAIVPVSQKKHLFSKAAISFSRDMFYCNLEETLMPVRREAFEKLVKCIEALRGVGIVKTDIEAGRIGGAFIKNYGIAYQERAIDIIAGCRRSGMFSLALFLAQKMDEEEAECYLDFRPRTK